MPITKARRAELEAELLKTMDRLDALKVELRESQADHRDQVKLHATKLMELRDILSGREAEQTSIPGTEAGQVKPRKAALAKRLLSRAVSEVIGNALKPRPTGELTRWVADERARRVPTFVIEQTGLKTKAHVIAKYGNNVAFEKGKPTPRPPERSLLAGKLKAPAAPKASKMAPPPTSTPVAELRWTEDKGVLELVVGTGTWRLQEITPTRWVLESKSQRERAWHKEGVFESQARAEEELRRTCGTDLVVPRLTADDVKDELCLDCGVAAGKPSPGCEGCDHPEARPAFSGITWIATDGSRTAFTGEAGSMAFRLTHREDNRWELENRSARERVFHTVGVLATRAEAEERVRLVVEGKAEPLDALVGSRGAAVKRHARASP